VEYLILCCFQALSEMVEDVKDFYIKITADGTKIFIDKGNFMLI
jgi:hypothetical protein